MGRAFVNSRYGKRLPSKLDDCRCTIGTMTQSSGTGGDDRTDHVLNLIDGALDDWTSTDAMRWRPDGAGETDPSSPFTGDSGYLLPVATSVELARVGYEAHRWLERTSLAVEDYVGGAFTFDLDEDASERLAAVVDQYFAGSFVDEVVEASQPAASDVYADMVDLWRQLDRQPYRPTLHLAPPPTPLLHVGQRVTVERWPDGTVPVSEEWVVLDVGLDGTATLASAETVDAAITVGEPEPSSPRPLTRADRPNWQSPYGPRRRRDR